MSKITLEPNSSGAGTFSIVSPDSNTNRTLTLPDESGTVATIENIPPGYEDQDALDLFNVTGSAPVYACRAWVNFDGTGTVSIRESGNVSSITDRGAGQYTVNFTTAMEDAEYSVTGTAGLDGSGGRGAVFCVDSNVSTPLLTNSCSILTHIITTSNIYRDMEIVLLSIFR